MTTLPLVPTAPTFRALARGAVCSLLVALPVAAAPPALASPTPTPVLVAPADKQTSPRIKDAVTDDADVLDDAAAAKVVKEVESSGASLWVVTMRDDSTTAQEWATSAWSQSGFGSDDLLLVINLPDSGINTFAFDGDAKGSVWSQSKRDSARKEIKARLRERDFDGAVAAVADSSGSGGTGLGTAALLGGGVAVVGGAVAYRQIKKRKQYEGAGTTNRSEPSLEQLQTQAGNDLVAADNAVRAAAEELSYAQAQFGLSATDVFTQALERAQEHVTASFELRKRLDDDVPETVAQQRAMLAEIIKRCQAAKDEIQAQEAEFSKRRGLEANLPEVLEETAQRADEAEQAISQARSVLATLQATYPASSLASVSGAPDKAQRLVEAARTALAQARASRDSGQQLAAVEQVRIAQASIGQASTLTAQVTGAREHLAKALDALQPAIASISSDLSDAERLRDQVPATVLEPLVQDAEQAVAQGRAATNPNHPGDPLGALERLSQAEAALDAALAPAREHEDNARRSAEQLAARLGRLSAQVSSVTTYITTHRGAIGPSARTALSEASRHLAQANGLQHADPVQALQEVALGEPLVAQAQALAEADVRNSTGGWSSGGGWGSPGPGRWGGGSGVDLGSLVLGGILLGGGRGGYGGWGSSGGGGLGGWGGSGSGGFGGGGGRF